jgi:NADP-dependent 3-hydroxy acid dehydrogenase YdfG
MNLLARGRADLDRMAAAVEAAGVSALVVPGDAADEGTAARAVEATLARFGRLDCLVAAQGTGTFGPLEASRLAEWDAMVRGNLTATYLLCRAVLPPMLAARRGTIVAVVSLAAVRAIPGMRGIHRVKVGSSGWFVRSRRRCARGAWG